MKLIIRWAILALALFLAARLVSGIHLDDTRGWIVYAVVAIVLSLVNALIRPILKFLTCPLILLTLGLFTLVINAGTLWLSAYISNRFLNVGYYIDGFWPAFWGGIIVSVVSVVLNAVVKDDDKDQRRRDRRRD